MYLFYTTGQFLDRQLQFHLLFYDQLHFTVHHYPNSFTLISQFHSFSLIRLALHNPLNSFTLNRFYSYSLIQPHFTVNHQQLHTGQLLQFYLYFFLSASLLCSLFFEQVHTCQLVSLFFIIDQLHFTVHHSPFSSTKKIRYVHISSFSDQLHLSSFFDSFTAHHSLVSLTLIISFNLSSYSTSPCFTVNRYLIRCAFHYSLLSFTYHHSLISFPSHQSPISFTFHHLLISFTFNHSLINVPSLIILLPFFLFFMFSFSTENFTLC